MTFKKNSINCVAYQKFLNYFLFIIPLNFKSGDPHVNILVKTNLKRKYSVHELFGFDVILDENLKPWIVEVNISPR